MEAVVGKVSPRKSNRSLPSLYSSCLLYQPEATDTLRGIKIASCDPGNAGQIHVEEEADFVETGMPHL